MKEKNIYISGPYLSTFTFSITLPHFRFCFFFLFLFLPIQPLEHEHELIWICFFLGFCAPWFLFLLFRWLVMFRERFIYLLWYRKRSYWTKIKTRNQTTIAIQRQNTKTNDQIICGRKQFTENHALIAMNPYLLINVAIIKSSALQKYRPS